MKILPSITIEEALRDRQPLSPAVQQLADAVNGYFNGEGYRSLPTAVLEGEGKITLLYPLLVRDPIHSALASTLTETDIRREDISGNKPIQVLSKAKEAICQCDGHLIQYDFPATTEQLQAIVTRINELSKKKWLVEAYVRDSSGSASKSR